MLKTKTLLMSIILVFSVNVVIQAQFESKGSKCLSNQNCGGGNCFSDIVEDSTCATTTTRCYVYANGTLQALQFKACTDWDSADQTCMAIPLDASKQIVCANMRRWKCGCVTLAEQPDGSVLASCLTDTCSCSGDDDGQVHDKGFVTTCT